jgi:hypothetical protein
MKFSSKFSYIPTFHVQNNFYEQLLMGHKFAKTASKKSMNMSFDLIIGQSKNEDRPFF